MDEKSEVTEGPKPGRRRTIVYAAIGAGALLTLVAARPITAAIQNGAGGFHHSWRGHWGGGGQAMSPEAAKEHLQIATKWMLRDIDASAEQQERVNAIVKQQTLCVCGARIHARARWAQLQQQAPAVACVWAHVRVARDQPNA